LSETLSHLSRATLVERPLGFDAVGEAKPSGCFLASNPASHAGRAAAGGAAAHQLDVAYEFGRA
jgi:hypothetical protein